MQSILNDFFKGLIFGATLMAIPGPILFLIIQRTLTEGIIIGLVCGLGSTISYTLYAALAGVGMSWVLQYMLDYKLWITLFGALFIIYLGISTYQQKAESTIKVSEKGLFSAGFSTFLLSLANPVTILSYCIFFAGFGTVNQDGAGIWAMIVGIALGSLGILLLVIGILRLFMHRISVSHLNSINKFAGIILVFFGIATFLKVINDMFN